VTSMRPLYHSILLVCSVLYGAAPAYAMAAEDDPNINSYFAARIAEMDNRGNDALKGYLGLIKTNADSAALADRVLKNAITVGDMQSAVKAVRALELKNKADGTAPMLLFADAFRTKDWASANIAIAELKAKSNYGFTAPMLESWIKVSQGKAHGLTTIDANKEPLLNYYSTDQRLYLELASKNYKKSKDLMGLFERVDGDFARDLIIRSAPIFAANSEKEFAVSSATPLVEARYWSELTAEKQPKARANLSESEGLAALYTRLAATLLEQKVPDQALILSRIAAWLDPSSDPAKLTLSKALAANDNTGLASRILLGVPETSPYWPRAIADQARLLKDSDKPSEALKLAKSALEKQPYSSNLTLLTAQMDENAGDYKAAALGYKKLADDPRTAELAPRQKGVYLLLLATALDKSGQWDEARKNLEEARSINPDNAYILNYLGYALLERNQDLPQALEFVRKAHQLAPNSVAITDSLGWAYYLTGKYDQAVPLLEKAVQQSENDVTINEHLGDAYWQTGRKIDARYAWKVAAHKASAEDAIRLANKIDFGLIKAVQPK
jgi:Flp pilus assembly protein TadD